MESKIIWAVDPFASNMKPQEKTAKVLALLARGTKVSIEPVAVLSPDQLKMPVNAFSGKSKEYRLEAETLMAKWLKKVKVPNCSAPTLLVQDRYSKSQTVKILLEYARSSGADSIVVSTRSVKGIEHLLLGSFAETLVLHSDVPVLIVNPQTKVPTRLDKILFPTDFSASSHLALKTLLPLAKTKKAKLTLFHKIDYVLPQTVDLIYSVPTYNEYVAQDLSEKKKIAQTWQEECKRAGVKADALFDERPGFVVSSILSALKKSKTDLVAMSAHSGPVEAAVLGSATRQIVRLASCPVWIIHPNQTGKDKEKDNNKNSPWLANPPILS